MMEQIGTAMLLRKPRNDMVILGTNESIAPQTLYFNKAEEPYLRLSREIEVPSLPIHHDVRIKSPRDEYLGALRSVLAQITELCPALLEGLAYSFNPGDTLRPTFFALYRRDTQDYLYYVRIDLSPRHGSIRIVTPGNNDTTPTWRSSYLFFESELIPVSTIEETDDGLLICPRQSISETWIGETGRGYFVQGIWLDRDLTKFFSKLFIPQGKKLYPLFPFNCRFRAVCATVLRLGLRGRLETLADLHEARVFIESHMSLIEESLHKSEFSEDLDTFISLRAMVGSSRIGEHLRAFSVSTYLNTEDEKEYELSIHSQ